jgi:hypothetical protein
VNPEVAPPRDDDWHYVAPYERSASSEWLIVIGILGVFGVAILAAMAFVGLGVMDWL